MTWDGTRQRLFLNGTQVAHPRARRDPCERAGALRFGGNTSGPSGSRGRLDEIRIYDRTLAAAELPADMTTPVSAGT